ncbi:hypothetical protein V5N11_000523 [Cardamine amara subsp. amara]|uniref:Uncharacterized protein n=1 Tax=Cardamine amara subsp. amara TaxID=228776 RepID=A0ABD0ZNM9_CARAN
MASPPPVFAVTPAAATANSPDWSSILILILAVIIVFSFQLSGCDRTYKQKPKPLKKEILKSLPKLTLSQGCVMTVRACRCVICLGASVASVRT